MFNLIKGVFFKSESDISSNYFLSLEIKDKGNNAVLKVYETDEFLDYKVGEEISLDEIDLELICEINLWGKYFFPKFNNEMQLYYDDEKYYKQKYKTNSITSLFEAINYGIEYGLNKSGIVPY